MESCPEEIIEKILIDSSADELKQLLLVSKHLNSIISNSLKLMSKFTFVLETAQKKANEIIYLDKSTRKYSNVTISKGNAFSIDNDLQIIKNMTKFLKTLTFQDCVYSNYDYLSILEVVGPAVGEIKFQNCKIVNILHDVDIRKPKATKPEPKFDKLKLLRLYDTNLDVGELISHEKLTELDIFMDERHFFDATVIDGTIACYRRSETGNLIKLLSTFPNLTKLKFALENPWTVSDFDDPSSYFGRFEQIPGKTYELPKLQILELSNIRDLHKEVVMNFIKGFSPSLKTLVLSKCVSSLSLSRFMELLGSLTILEKMVVDIYQEDDIPTVFHENLRELDVYFSQQPDEFVGQVFSAVPNLQVLKSNVPDEIVAIFIQEGKLQKLKSYVECDREGDADYMDFSGFEFEFADILDIDEDYDDADFDGDDDFDDGYDAADYYDNYDGDYDDFDDFVDGPGRPG